MNRGKGTKGVKWLEHEDPELGTVRLCRSCGEDWPVDRDFWYFDREGRVMGRCRACWSDRNRNRYAADGWRTPPFAPMEVAS